MDFVFDRTAEGRVLKCLAIVDDATHEAVAIEVEMVRPEGVEPPTRGVEDRCSIQLSYGRDCPCGPVGT